MVEPQPGQFHALGVVRTLDEEMMPVDGASVEVVWQRPVGPPVLQTRVTRPNGVTAFNPAHLLPVYLAGQPGWTGKPRTVVR